PHDLGAPVPCWLKTWKGDGILARIEDRRSAELIRRTGLPAVDLRFSVPDTGLPGVGIDNRAVGKLAFEHLRDAGLKQFALRPRASGDRRLPPRRRDGARRGRRDRRR